MLSENVHVDLEWLGHSGSSAAVLALILLLLVIIVWTPIISKVMASSFASYLSFGIVL